MDVSETYRLTLGIDTATHVQSVAVLDEDRALDDCRRRVRFDHGSSLLANIDSALEEHRLQAEDLDLIAVGIGPGSFVGLRVGLALAKGIARADEIPLVGVSSVAAQAYVRAATHPGEYVCAAFDARRSEVFTGIFRWTGEDGLQAHVDDCLVAPDDIRGELDDLLEAGERVSVVGNGARVYESLHKWDDEATETQRITVLPEWTEGPSGVGIAQLGRQKMAAAGPDSIHDLEPNYIRPSSAEENRQKKLADED